jgi:delta 1-pyrroline-5-carboxylate dehydrogenase
VLSVLTFRTPDEAIAKANNTPYGLSAGIWTDKGSRILAVADRLRAGVVWANTFNRFDPASPFGGYKESGYGREGGRHGLAAYLAPPAATPRKAAEGAERSIASRSVSGGLENVASRTDARTATSETPSADKNAQPEGANAARASRSSSKSALKKGSAK